LKRVETLIRPEQLEAANKALRDAGVSGVTATEVLTVTPEQGETIRYRGVEYERGLVARVKLEVVVHDDLVERVITAVLRTARTGYPDDGEILVVPIENAVRIRTYEIAEAAIS